MGAAPGEGFTAAGAVCAAGDACGDTAVVGEGCGVGVGVGTGTVSDCSTVREPDTPGNESISAISMNAAAAPIVIRARMLCVPRGPNAVLETLLVNNAPASALPGCSKTTTIRIRHARTNNPYKR